MNPILYEINTRCWLRELSQRNGTPLTLANVPESEFQAWQRLGFTHIWLMGVWTTGPRSRAEALGPGLRAAYAQLLPDWSEASIPGSPYAISHYNVPAELGGDAGLKAFRDKLHSHGLKLVLDFVPNHMGLDHPWVRERPELFVQSPGAAPDTFAQQTTRGQLWLAHGKDPNFPGWTDTVQLDYRRPATRTAMSELLRSVAARCDGVRCDMSMLLLNDVFARTWERFPLLEGQAPAAEFWPAAISTVKERHPSFLFLSEVYWGLEGRMQDLGFDYTYDKWLYDGLVARDAGRAQRHLLGAPPGFVAASAHFLENHDEPRIAALLTPAEHRAAAVLILGLPGMRFLYEGQLSGNRLKIPVQMARRPAEAETAEIARMYQQLLTVFPASSVGSGQAELLEPRSAWPNNPTEQNFVIVQWQTQPPAFDIVVVNLAPHRSQCYAQLKLTELGTYNWSMTDLLGEERYQRAGEDLQNQGVYFDLPPHGAQLFHFDVA